MRLQDKINKEVRKKTGFSVNALDSDNELTKSEILEILENHKYWIENYALDLKSGVDRVIRDYELNE